MTRFLVTFLFSFFSFYSFATSFSGGIYSSTTWTLSNSPYIITGDVVVFEGATLTIEPGVEIKVDGNYLLEVRGKIVAQGTATDNIIFKANATNAGRSAWKGIKFGGTFNASTYQGIFDHCTISNAYHCFDMQNATQGPYNFKNSTFSQNYYVIEDDGLGGTRFIGCKFLDNNMGTYWYGGSLYDCEFDGNDYGVWSCDSLVNCTFTNTLYVAASPYGYTANCEFHDNNIAVQTGFNSVNKTFINNKVHNNTIGMELGTFFPGINFYGNEFCDNVQYNIKRTTSHNADLSNNCWCSTDSAYIRSKIYDGYTDVSTGLVVFTPFNTGCTNFPAAISTLDIGNTFDIYPNPSTDGRLHLSYSKAGNYTIVIVDILGKVLSYSSKAVRSNNMSIVLHDAAKGTYFMNITDTGTGEQVTKKFVLQ